jgi:hypothetical protein
MPIYATLRNEDVHRIAGEVFWRKDGTSLCVEYTSTPVEEGGETVGAVVVFKTSPSAGELRKSS